MNFTYQYVIEMHGYALKEFETTYPILIYSGSAASFGKGFFNRFWNVRFCKVMRGYALKEFETTYENLWKPMKTYVIHIATYEG